MIERRAALIAALDRAEDFDDENAPDFVWGERDCLMRCADIVRDAIGIDPAEPWRGKYDSEEGAAVLVGPRGVLWTTRQRARELGMRRVFKVADAETGDWGVAQTRLGLASVMKHKSGLWFGCIDRGFALIPGSNVKAAWSFC